MAVRGDEVANSIDTQVRGAVEKLVEEIRSSIEDIRQVVDQQLKAALQSVQADVNALSVLPAIQKAIGELEESFGASHPAASTADAGRVKKAVQAVERGKSQVDILNALLDQCLEFGSRAALLILRGETFSGWKGLGFSAHGGSDDLIKRFNAAPGLIPELDEVLRHERVADWDGVNLSTRFGVSASTRALLVPMVIKDKVAAVVYLDAVAADAGKLDKASLELLVFTTGLLIDTLAIRKKSPSPSLSDESGPAVVAPAPAAPPAPPAVAPPRAQTAPQAAPPPPPPESATVAINAQQIRDMMGTVAPPPPPRFNAPPAGEASSPVPAPTAPQPAIPAEERPSTQFVPPAGLANRSTFSGPMTDDAKKHDEARRFARLLVSEIKLYNEPKVDAGRKNKDLYERLKEDIDRSRQMYDERIGEDVRTKSNYFYDELVRILADGHAEVLGM